MCASSTNVGKLYYLN